MPRPPSAHRSPTTAKLWIFIPLWIIAALLTAAGQAEPPRVQFVHSSPKLEPTTTFEFRFPVPMVAASAVGKVADPAPVELHPLVKGRFTWLSTRSGTFAPETALTLGTTLRFTLRPGLKTLDGNLLAAALDAVIETPALLLKGAASPNYFSNTDAPARPSYNLLFNADVNAAEAAGYLSFVNADGLRIPATVLLADPAQHAEQRFPTYRSSDRSLLTWAAQFDEHPAAALATGRTEVERHNQLFVTPAQPLIPASGWKLVLAAGLFAADKSCQLMEPVEVAIGQVKPFVIVSIKAENDGTRSRRIVLEFSKGLAEVVQPETLARWISVSPVPANLATTVRGQSIEIAGDFALAADYTVNVASGLPAREPFALKNAVTEIVRFEPIEPGLALEEYATHQLSTGQRRFHLKAVNVPRLRVTAKLFQPDTVPYALAAWDDYLDTKNGQETGKLDPGKLAGRAVYQQEITGTDQVDTEREITLNWDEILGPGQTGAVLLTAEQVADAEHPGPRPGVQAVIQVTDLGVVWKRSKTETFAHVFSLATGEPLAGVKLQYFSAENIPLEGTTTDASGIARLPATKARWLLAALGTDLHLVALDAGANALSLYRFHLSQRDFDEEDEANDANGRQALLFTERDAYKPGETVYVKGIVRDLRDGQPRIPAGANAVLTATDARARTIFTRQLTLSASGAFDAAVPLPTGTLGSCTIALTLRSDPGAEANDEASFTHEIEVQEYTPNTFEIKIGGADKLLGSGPVELPVRAQYFMGKSLSQARLTWSLEATDAGFAPEGGEGFVFCDGIGDRRLRQALDRDSSFSDQGKLELGGDGQAIIATTLQLNRKAPQPRAIHLLCEVTDLDQQTVSAARDYALDSSEFYLGLGTLPSVLHQGDQLPIQLVALRANGTPQPEAVSAKLRLTRIDWQNNRVESDADASEIQTEPIFKIISEKELTTQPLQQIEHRWAVSSSGLRESGLTAGEPGLYLLEATTRDGAGREVATALTFYVSGPEVTEWNYRSEFQIDLVADKTAYLSGETAHILVKTPISGEALVTVERDQVLRSFLIKLSGNAPSVDVPLEGTDAPNIFVSVLLLRGAQDSPRKLQRPDYRVGFCALKVTRPEARLAVRVTPERKAYRPGEEVSVTAEIHDLRGQPRPGAEVTLYAVDEGVLSLTDYTTPDPYAFFNEPLPLAVSTSLTLPTLLKEDPEDRTFENKGYTIGGGGDASEALRKNFITCAFWSGALETDATGRATAKFTAPDSLTRYRVIAVVQTKDDAFGSGESSFEVNKPVMFEPALPRFANLGDRLLLRGVLHNLTALAGAVEVRLELDDKATASEATTRQVTLPAHGSLAVDFPVEFKLAGEAKWKWTARFISADGQTDYRDAVESTLQVGYPVALLREVQLGRAEKPETDLLAKSNPALLEGVGVIRVSVANSRIIELRESLSQLLHYPYGCVEQTTSSTLPWILLRDFRTVLPELAKSDSEVAKAVNYGIDRLFTMQTSDGGLAYWPGGTESHFWGSAYGGLGLALARRAGFTVPEEDFTKLCNFLSSALRGSGDTNDRALLADRCLAAYTLAVAGHAESGYHEVLYQKRELLTDESRALLALAVLESKGPATLVAELLQPKQTAPNDDDAFWCESRQSAIRLLAWSQYRADAPVVDELASELFGRRIGGHWSTTQGNCWALLALGDYLRRVEKPALKIDGVLAWGQQREPFHLDPRKPIERRSFALGTERANLRLLTPGGKRVFTEVEIEARPRTLLQPRQDQGYAIERQYAKVGDDNSISELKDPRVGDRVLVTLRIVVRRTARYLAVDDPLPAIFEAINPVFKSQETAAAAQLEDEWLSDYHELRADRALFFGDYVTPGTYTIRYLARVRAAGTATAPAAKVEEMYHPERFGMTATQQLTSQPLK